MMFIKLTFVGDRDTYVNVHQITRIYRAEVGTYICFHGDDYIVVKETPDEICNRIQKYRGEL